jgi:hypothetical protein
MKFVTITLALLMVVALAASANDLLTNKYEEKKLVPNGAQGDGREGGETIGTAWVIPSLPFYDTGDTSDNIDDYDEVCPYSGSTSPDVVYQYTAPEDMCVDIDLCLSGYDTKVYVYENMYTPNAPYACNDDNGACALLYRSWIQQLYLTGGNTYYIVVDGYGGDAGVYDFNMYEVSCPIPCTPICPGDAILEGEPTCYPDYDDIYNGGCNSTPYVFQSIPTAPLLTICGESGVFPFGTSTYRDTDWFEVFLTEDRQVTLRLCADFPNVIGFIDASLGCGAPAFYSYAVGDAFYITEHSDFLTGGPWWIFVSTADWGDYPCGSEYVLEIEGTAYSPVEDASWSTIKAMYK